jgi:hypothetical protein
VTDYKAGMPRGPKVILMGLPGTGKTDSIRTLIEAGLKVFVVFSEPGMEVLLDARRGRKVYTCKDGLHWRYHPVATPDWSDLQTIANLMNQFSFQQLSDQAPLGREKYHAFMDIIATLGNLKCERCNTVFGPADHLTPYHEWCLVQDSMSSLSLACLYGLIGNKPGIHQGEWGVAMGNLERLFNKFAYDIPSMMVMTAHIEIEPNPVGGTKLMVSTLGNKLAPKVPRAWSDCVLATREGNNFYWSSTDTTAFLKTRNFDFSNRIPPSFVPIVQEWHKRIRAEAAAKEASIATIAAVQGAPIKA